MNLSKQILGSSLSLPAYERAGQTQHLFFWRRISQSEIRNSAVAEKSESESEGGQKLVPCRDTGFLPPQPLSFLPARAFGLARACPPKPRRRREARRQFRSKKVRISSNKRTTKFSRSLPSLRRL